MGNIDTYLERNEHFAATRFTAGLRIAPARKTLLVGCLDPRVDPAEILGFELGDVGIIRNVGGRITPAVIDEVALLMTLTQHLGGNLGPGWDLIVLQHTDCGITRLQEPPEQLAAFFAVDAAALPDKNVGNPREAILTDIEVLRGATKLPGTFQVTGLLYDVATGRAETVAGPAPLRVD